MALIVYDLSTSVILGCRSGEGHGYLRGGQPPSVAFLRCRLWGLLMRCSSLGFELRPHPGEAWPECMGSVLELRE